MSVATPTDTEFRPGVVVDPVHRLDKARIEMLHKASMAILDDPGILCFNEAAVELFDKNGCPCQRDEDEGAWRVRLNEQIVRSALESAPSRVVLGARNPANKLDLDSERPRIYFGTGSETNIILETEMVECTATDGSDRTERVPFFKETRGSAARLCDSARLCNALEHVDFFIRNVNLQDPAITEANKDVNVFFAALLYMTKHVQAGLADLNQLDEVLKLASMLAGGDEALRANPLVSFIACVVKSPLQMVEDTADKVIAIAKAGMPLVISSSPQGGSTAPIQEEGMVALINAEILAGITLNQLAQPGAPVLYGAVPVRARLDTLHDLYGAPEFVHYNTDCIQMARHYRIPCYSTAGVADAKTPGLQAAAEKMFSHLAIAQAGAQYIHYAFGLLDRTNIFCPVQAVIDNANIGQVKQIVRKPVFGDEDAQKAVKDVRKVMASSNRLFARQIRKYRRKGLVSEPYPLEGASVIENACAEVERIRATAGERLPDEMIQQIRGAFSDLLPQERFDPTQ